MVVDSYDEGAEMQFFKWLSTWGCDCLRVEVRVGWVAWGGW